MPFDPSNPVSSLLEMLGLGGTQQQPPSPQSSQISNLAGAGFPGAQQMNQANPPPQIAGQAQATQDPMLLAAQLGATPQGSPDVAAIQAQLAAAQQGQSRRALEMGLIQGGLGMAGARDPLGYPAPFGQAASQGFTQGLNADQQYLQNARQTSQALLGAQGAGQQLQMGASQLADAAKLKQMFGLSDPKAIAWVQAMQSGAAMKAQLMQTAQDPSLTPQQRSIAAQLAGMPPQQLAAEGITKVLGAIYAKPVDPTTAARNTATAGLANARAKEVPGLAAATISKDKATGGAMGAYHDVMADTGVWKQAATDAQNIANNVEGQAIAKAVGTSIDVGYLQKMLHDERTGKPADVPTAAQVPDDGKPHRGVSADGAVVWWARHGMTVMPVVAPGGSPTPLYTGTEPAAPPSEGAAATGTGPEVPE